MPFHFRYPAYPLLTVANSLHDLVTPSEIAGRSRFFIAARAHGVMGIVLTDQPFLYAVRKAVFDKERPVSAIMIVFHSSLISKH